MKDVFPEGNFLLNDCSQKFLITGGAGFIGSALVRRLVRETSHSVLVVDKLTYAGNLDSLAPISSDPRYNFAMVDIADEVRIATLVDDFQPDVVMHLAAESHVDRSIIEPAAFVQTNVVGSVSLLRAAQRYWEAMEPARRHRFRFHHISTDEVFGSLGETGAFAEDTPYDPRSPYSASKAASDHFVRAWFHTYSLPIVITNCSNNYGPYQFPEKLIPLMILKGLEGRAMPVYGDGSNVRDWLYVGDHVDALLRVVFEGKQGETYCIGGNGERSNLEVVKQICALLDELAPDPSIGRREQLIAFVEDRPGHDQRYAIDPSRVVNELGWSPKETFETGLAKTVQWYLDNREWWQRVQTGVYRGERLGLSAKG